MKFIRKAYAFTKKIKIERTKTFQRFLERKKATFELVFHSVQYFVMAKKTVSARAQVKLDTLLSKCEIHEMIPVS